MKLVKFKDGTYGVRKWSWFFMSYMYLDLIYKQYWWDKRDSFFKDCKGTEAECRSAIDYIKDHGTAIMGKTLK